MRVVNNGQTVFIGWEYDNKNHPDVTKCIMKNQEKEEIFSATVVRYHKDPCDKDKARRFSLTKLLRMKFPGKEEKEVRRAFWDAYITRNDAARVKSII